jgi:uncharacterized membrane protein YGL010W
MLRFLENYAQRHQHPGNIAFHVLGLPVTFLLPPVLLWFGQGWWALTSFLVGYALQFAGHAIEGNDAGEVVLVKKLLGLPYVAIVPRRKP